jgi:hypothetical protein
MAVGFNSIQLLVLSGLLQDKGLRLPLELTTRLDQIKDTASLSGRLSYIAWHPQSNASMTTIRNTMRQLVPGLAAVVPSSYTTILPEGLRIFDVVGSIKTRADNLMGNGLKGILENLSICAGELQKSFDVQASLDTYKTAKFSDIYLNATSYRDVISHGLTASFGSGAASTPSALQAKEQNRSVTTKEIRRELGVLNTAIRNLGSLYDWTDLNTVGSAHAFVKNLYKIGAAYNTQLNNLMTQFGYSLDSIGPRDNAGLTQLLQKITGKDIGIILKASGATPPNISAIVSAADFLNATKVMSIESWRSLPNQDLQQLGKKLISLGINSTNINEILGVLTTVEIADLEKLNALSVPVPSVDVKIIQDTLISGGGPFQNATLDDLLGVLTGNNYYDSMDSIIAANKYFTKNSSGLVEAAQSIVTTLSTNGTVNSTQATNFVTAATALRKAIDDAKAKIPKVKSLTPTIDEIIWNTYNSAETSVVKLIDSLRKEIVNGEIINLAITSNLIVSSANTTVDSFDIRNIRKAIYKIEVQNENKFDDFEAKVIHNGNVANVLIYNRSLVGTNVSLGNVYASVNTSSNTCTVTYATTTDNNFHHFLRSIVDYTPIHDGSNPGTLQGSSAEINALYQLDEIASDKQFTGIGTLLESMANNDVYGEAILASLVTSRNSTKLQVIGINGKKADPLDRLTAVLSKQGRGLSASQRKAILETSAADNTDANLAISNASRHGYFSDYYQKKGKFP